MIPAGLGNLADGSMLFNQDDKYIDLASKNIGILKMLDHFLYTEDVSSSRTLTRL